MDWNPAKFDVPEAPDKDRFHDFALPETLMHAIHDLEYQYCTPIQSAVLPMSLADYDVTGRAQTGTGKTAAFLITMLTHMWEKPLERPLPPGTPRALVLAPTRELALQIESDANALGRHMDINAQCVVGGIDFQKQRERLQRQPVDILIATPGRLLDFINRRDIHLRRVEVLVIDEADRMLDMGFIPDVRRIVYQTPHKRERQTLFFSATFNDDVMRLASSWTIDPEHVVIAPESVATDAVDQKFWLVSADRKAQILTEFLQNAPPERALIFTNRRDQTHHLFRLLSRKGIKCEPLAGDVPQRKRLSTMNKFKEGELAYLVATDVAGRGIHVDDISHVINYDLPEDAEDYVHRIGRTGRAGKTGTSISFVSEDDAFNLPAIEEYLGESVVCTQPEF
ncbi:MAG: DEAD/DEAH box helicase [Pseudomonadales bacterium]|nr:DEAD/DEAH box helicase [Pseudomonadales bacterium]MDP6470965.1 DEAD/DEAH box helicase [Pseudomonadales bacterium]MDP6825850.1 DEAD/DEAH box helicase [Pseudomonadales bacterium]MDP6972817.1 DEAD/DEAH box helicase [Pseudomonadales bacterium]